MSEHGTHASYKDPNQPTDPPFPPFAVSGMLLGAEDTLVRLTFVRDRAGSGTGAHRWWGLVWGGRVWQWAVTRGWSVVLAGAR